MRRENIMFSSSAVPIISIDGKKEDEIKLPEKIYPVPRRRCGISKMGLHYKGAGIIYTGHYVNDYDPEDSRLSLVEKTGISYEKYHVIYPALYRRYGIFLFLHQPIFSDFEGACGKKRAEFDCYAKEISLFCNCGNCRCAPHPFTRAFHLCLSNERGNGKLL